MAKIEHNVILIKPTQLLKAGHTAGDRLLEATMGVWRVGDRSERADYAFAIKEGRVIEVYAIDRWQPAGTHRYRYRPEDEVQRPRRREFIGRVADEPIRRRYLGMDVSHLFKQGAQNPIRYVNC